MMEKPSTVSPREVTKRLDPKAVDSPLASEQFAST